MTAAERLSVARFAPVDCCPDCGGIGPDDEYRAWEPIATLYTKPDGRRFRYRCGWCGKSWACWFAYHCEDCGDGDDLTVDHIWPQAKNGTDYAENLRILCRSCNSRKGARLTHDCPSCGRP